MKENNKIIHVLIAMCGIFLILVVYLTWFQVFESEKYTQSSYNRRQQEIENNILRGVIYDRNAKVLAKSDMKDGKQERIYPFGALYSQVIGYNSKVYGRSMLEAAYNDYLLGLNSYGAVLNTINKFVSEDDTNGNNLYLTIDHNLQAMGDGLLEGKKGSIVAMNPKTGEILAMVSKPGFDTGEKSLEYNWKALTESKDSPFLPRATQGLYVPGSTFKVLTCASAIENGLEDMRFDDNGVVNIDGMNISNSGSEAHGNLGISDALVVSSNVVYSQLGVKLGEKNLKDMTQRVGFGEDIPFDLPVNKSIFPYDKMGKNDMAAVGMGQGKIMVTPLHMAMITSAIANKGIMMKPILVNNIVASNGKNVKSSKPSELYRVMKPEVANKVKDMMKGVVQKGTGTNAAIPGISVAGKTGTAENELTAKQKNKEHAWFIGFAPADDPKIAVAVIIEYGGSYGGVTAAPIAQNIMAQYLGKK